MYMKFANTCDNMNNDKNHYVMKPRHANKSRAKGERSLRELGHTTENEKRRAICNPAMPKTSSDIFVGTLLYGSIKWLTTLKTV